jgi:hypothetical protein
MVDPEQTPGPKNIPLIVDDQWSGDFLSKVGAEFPKIKSLKVSWKEDVTLGKGLRLGGCDPALVRNTTATTAPRTTSPRNPCFFVPCEEVCGMDPDWQRPQTSVAFGSEGYASHCSRRGHSDDSNGLERAAPEMRGARAIAEKEFM